MATFEDGALVQLKSSDVIMTVLPGSTDRQVPVAWMDKQSVLQRANIPVEALMLYDRDYAKAIRLSGGADQ